MHKLILTFGCVFLLTGCLTPTALMDIEPHVTSSHEPLELEQEQLIQTGDVVLTTRYYSVYPAIELLETVYATRGPLVSCSVPAQTLVAKHEDESWRYYKGRNVMRDDLGGEPSSVYGGIKIRKKPRARDNALVFCSNRNTALYPKNEQALVYDHSTHTQERYNESKYSLIYNGKADGKLYFNYFSPGELRGRSKRVIEFDPDEESILKVGGAEIKILSANRMKLSYLVLKRFDE